MRSDLRPDPRPRKGAAALVEGIVRGCEQDQQTRQWTLTVELHGGRIIRRVKPTYSVAGAVSGVKPPLPPQGCGVLVGFPESGEYHGAYILACFDAYPHGLDQDSAEESVSLHPSGLGHAISPDGTTTTLFPGGGELVVGPGAGYEFLVRGTDGKPFKPKFPQRALRVMADFAQNGLLMGARLFGGLELLADAAKKTILLKVGERDLLRLRPGEVRIQSGSVVVGENEGMTASVARWPEVKATLSALAQELQQVKHEVVMLRAKTNQHDAQIEIITTFPLLMPIKIPVKAVPVIPLPLITPQGKDGALVAQKGGVQVVEAGAHTLHAE